MSVGETACIHTVAAFENKMTSEVEEFADVCAYPFLNSQTGPIVVGAAAHKGGHPSRPEGEKIPTPFDLTP